MSKILKTTKTVVLHNYSSNFSKGKKRLIVAHVSYKFNKQTLELVSHNESIYFHLNHSIYQSEFIEYFVSQIISCEDIHLALLSLGLTVENEFLDKSKLHTFNRASERLFFYEGLNLKENKIGDLGYE